MGHTYNNFLLICQIETKPYLNTKLSVSKPVRKVYGTDDAMMIKEPLWLDVSYLMIKFGLELE